jgi:hypothetical protein
VRVFWQGPSPGFDAGADGARTMMLLYTFRERRRFLTASAVLRAPRISSGVSV